jgi:hypothetical protein
MGMYGIDDSVWMHRLACLFQFIIYLLGDFYANVSFFFHAPWRRRSIKGLISGLCTF